MSEKGLLKSGDSEPNQIDAYIPRTISTTVVCLDTLLQALETLSFVIIINCNEDIRNNISGITVSETSTFLNGPVHIELKVVLLSIGKNCSLTEFETICTMTNMMSDTNVYLLDKIHEDSYRLVLKRGNNLKEDLFNNIEVEEVNALEFCNNELNVICAPAGMGKSTLFKTLQRNCPKDCLFVTLIEHNEFFKSEPSNDDMLQYFLKLDYSQHDFEIKKVLFENKKMYVFLDGLDEVDMAYIGIVLNFIKYLSSVGCSVWVSSRPNLEKLISVYLYAVPITINELNRSEQEDYIRKRLTSFEKFKVDESVEKIFKVADIGTSQQLLGVPLLLFMITECIIDNNPLLDFDETKGFVLTKIYKAFFERKKKFLYQETEIDGNEIQIGYSFNRQLELYQVAALESCLSSSELEKLTVAVATQEMEYLEQIEKEGDKFGIIQKVKTIPEKQTEQEGKKKNVRMIIFVHRTFAEYFVCVWFCRNIKRMNKINQEMFLRKNQNLRTMFDIMLAEDSPLHLAIIYRNFEQVEKQYQETFVDKGNRNSLYLMCCYGTNCVRFRNYHFDRLNREDQFYLRVVSKLITECQDISAVDNVYNFSYLEYAIRSCCLYPLEVAIQMRGIKMLIQIYGDTTSLVVYASQFGYSNLLRLVIQDITEKDIDKSYYWREAKSLLEVAALGCKNDKYNSPRKGNLETLALLVEHFVKLKQSSKERPIIEHFTNYVSPEKKLLNLICQLNCYEMIEYLAPKIVHTNEIHDTFLHSCLKFGTLTEKIIEIANNVKLIDAKNDLGQTVLHLACRNGNCEYVKWLVDYGTDINTTDKDIQNILHYVASSSKENLEILELFSFGECISKPDKYGVTPLHVACKFGHLNYVKKFFEEDDFSDLVDNNDANLLHSAAEASKNNVELIQFLKSNGVDPNAITELGEIPLHKACEAGVVENIETLIDRRSAKKRTQNRDTAFHYLGRNLTYKNDRAVDLLLSFGLDINARNKDGDTPLHIAVYKAKTHSNSNIATLLDRGADINATNIERKSLLHKLLEMYEDCSELVDFLIKRGISVNLQDKDGETALHVVLREHSSQDCKQLLLDNGADPNITNKWGMNVLHYAAEFSTEGILDCPELFLLKVSAEMFEKIMHKVTDKDLQDIKGRTALQVAAEYDRFDLMKVLLQQQVNVNLCDKYGYNLLHVLVGRKDNDDFREVVMMLIEKGINLNARNKKGLTPLHLSISEKRDKFTGMLIEAGADIYLKTYKNKNALDLAFSCRSYNELEMMIKRETEKSTAILEDPKVVYYSVYGGRSSIVKLIIDKNIDIDKIDVRNERFPLHHLQENGRINRELLLIMTNLIHDYCQTIRDWNKLFT